MLVTSEPNFTPQQHQQHQHHQQPHQYQQQHQPQQPHPHRASSILDSPTLARVERARLRLEGSVKNNGEQNSLERSILDKQLLLAGRIPIATMNGPIKRGLLWQQRDRLFSRWKERYFILTRDYLHCFKRASGPAQDRISDMGQFIFKIKLVDVEKVEWLNRRNYSAIGLLLGREGRVLLRCDNGLEDWFELLEECTLISKERRETLKVTQGPRSRASLAAPPTHSLQRNQLCLGSTYSSALDDWLMNNRNKNFHPMNPFLFSDSVPDLSNLNNENHNNGISTNHSTPQKIPYSNSINHYNTNNGYDNQNNLYSNGFYCSPRRIFTNNFSSTNIVNEEDEFDLVELRRPICNNDSGNGNDLEKDWMYRKPKGPTENYRHSEQTDLDYSACDSGLDTPSSTHRPSSYANSPRHSASTTVSSSFQVNHNNGMNESRFSVQDQRILRNRNNDESLIYDPNQNRYYYKMNNNSLNHTNGNNTNNNNSNNNNNGVGVFKERFQNPALAALINENSKFRDRSYSDCQQPRRVIANNNNNNIETSNQRSNPFFGSPTRV